MGDDAVVGAIIDGKYRLLRLLGEGGMAEVYEAEHVTLGSSFALKLAGAELASDPELARRFENEARVAARLKSDYVVRVTDVGVWGARPYMVMELLEGEDLEHLALRVQRLPVVEAVDYVLQALAALHDVHAAGIVHRDLKPSNLFLHTKGGMPPVVKLVDFGVATAGFTGKARVTTTGSTLGSPAYMSPEQLRSAKHVDGRADLWSVGVILYELLTGEMPFFGDNVGAVFAAILETDAPPPSTRSVGIPVGLDGIILKCLRRKPDERWGSAMELAAALAPWGSDEGRSLAGRIGATPSPSAIEVRISHALLPRAPLVQTISSVPPAARTIPPGKRSASEWSDSVARRPARRAIAIAAPIAFIATVLGAVAVWRIAPQHSPLSSSDPSRGVQGSSMTSMPSVVPSETAVVVSSAPIDVAPPATARASETVPVTPPAAHRDAGAAPIRRADPGLRARPAATAPIVPTDEERIFGRH